MNFDKYYSSWKLKFIFKQRVRSPPPLLFRNSKPKYAHQIVFFLCWIVKQISSFVLIPSSKYNKKRGGGEGAAATLPVPFQTSSWEWTELIVLVLCWIARLFSSFVLLPFVRYGRGGENRDWFPIPIQSFGSKIDGIDCDNFLLNFDQSSSLSTNIDDRGWYYYTHLWWIALILFLIKLTPHPI